MPRDEEEPNFVTGGNSARAQQQRSNFIGNNQQQYGQRRDNYLGSIQSQGRRSGLPQQGIVGAPNLGLVSELQRFQSQVPGGSQFLQSRGMMPNIQTSQFRPGSVSQFRPDANYGGQGMAPVNEQFPPGFSSYGINYPGMGQGGQQQGLTNQSAVPNNGSTTRQPSEFEGTLQNKITGLLNNPTGFDQIQQQQLRNRAAAPIAGQQQINEQRTREDAVRRGNYGGGDMDIRDQLNRVSAQGAADQGRAGQDIDMMLANLQRQGTQAGLGAGVGLLGQQMGDQKSIREMLTLLEGLNQQGGAAGQGLNFLMGI